MIDPSSQSNGLDDSKLSLLVWDVLVNGLEALSKLKKERLANG